MKLLILGSTGKTGKLVTRQALEQGYDVTALVRNPSKPQINNRNLKIVQGDVMDFTSLEASMLHQDAVICCIGTPPNKAGNIRSEGTKNVVRSMQLSGVNRFICQTSLGYDDSVAVLEQTPFLFKKVIVPLLLKKTFEEHSLQEKYIRQSKLNWTILRAGSLTNGKLTGNYKHGFPYNDKTIKVKISRADVADFLLKQLTTEVYLNKTTGISY